MYHEGCGPHPLLINWRTIMYMNETKNLAIPTLAERAMLVRLKRSMYQPYAFDASTTAQVEMQTGVRKAGRFNKRLFLDCYELRDANSALNDVYTFHMRNTVPWLDDGVRMLPASLYFEYNQTMSDLIRTAKAKIAKLVERWDYLVQQDMLRLGPLANSSDYPRDVACCYEVAVKFMPVPDVADFRVQISDEDKATLQSAIEEAEQGVAKYLLQEMLDPIRRAAEKLAVPIGEEGAIFRDTLMSNITDVVDRAKKLNISNDPQVAAVVDEITQSISVYARNPDRLREDVGARLDAQTKLDGIMSKLSGLF